MSAPGRYVEVTATKEPVVIWSGEHHAWWGPNRCGYYTDPSRFGTYTLAEAIHATHHVGPEKRIRIEDTPVALTECLSLVQINGELLATLKSVREFVKSELDVRVDSHTLGGVPMGFDYDGPRIIAEARERLERIDVVIAKAEGRGP